MLHYWGQGIVPKQHGFELSSAFTLLNLHEIEIHCYDYNKQSRRIAENWASPSKLVIRDHKDAFQGNRCADLISMNSLKRVRGGKEDELVQQLLINWSLLIL